MLSFACTLSSHSIVAHYTHDDQFVKEMGILFCVKLSSVELIHFTEVIASLACVEFPGKADYWELICIGLLIGVDQLIEISMADSVIVEICG